MTYCTSDARQVDVGLDLGRFKRLVVYAGIGVAEFLPEIAVAADVLCAQSYTRIKPSRETK